MCGRFNLFADGETIASYFGLVEIPRIVSRYNIAPTQPVMAIRARPNCRQTALFGKLETEVTYFRWGLMPSWAKELKWSNRLFNARSETVAEKASFRAPFKRRRCIIPASGFYEWQKTASGKQPIHIQPRRGKLLALAGLWENWQGADGTELQTCTILTTRPNELMAPVHNRMPVILKPSDFELWLNPNAPLAALPALFNPISAEALFTTPVSTYVNNARNEGAQAIQPLT